jgi:hypothetical protein
VNKKLNSVLFILCGKIVNVILAIFFIGALVLLVFRFHGFFGQWINVVVPAAFFSGILLAMFAYQRLLKWVMRRFTLEDKLDPLFSFKPKKK